jgi:hypothetical protein
MSIRTLSYAKKSGPLALALQERESRSLAKVDPSPISAERTAWLIGQQSQRAKATEGRLAKAICSAHKHRVYNVGF